MNYAAIPLYFLRTNTYLDWQNKQWFITLLSDHLKSHRCHTEHAKTDADLLIVQTDMLQLTEQQNQLSLLQMTQIF